MSEKEENSPTEDPSIDPDKEARMLLNPPADAVQFTQASPANNGQVSVTIGGNGTNGGVFRSGVGMTKQELMKYANDPFWVRLRLFLFILFWVVWLAMLVGSVLIIALAPGCPATASLPWFKKCSLVELKIAEIKPVQTVDSLTKAGEELQKLSEQLSALTNANVEGVLITGISPFLLAEPKNNVTGDALSKFKDLLTKFVADAHHEEKNVKIILDLTFSNTDLENEWFKESKKNGSDLESYYIWKNVNSDVLSNGYTWRFDTDANKFHYALRERAVLNFANPDVNAKVKALLLAWIRTKIDGIQLDGTFWKQDPTTLQAVKSLDSVTEYNKILKATGKNKAFIVKEPNLASGDGEDDGDFNPSWDLWKGFEKTSNLKEALLNAFAQGLSVPGEASASSVDNSSSLTAKSEDKLNKEDFGKKWKSSYIKFPESEDNKISKDKGKSIGEAVLAAVYFLPKVTPIISASSADLSKINGSYLLVRLSQLRKQHSEVFLLGTTHLPTIAPDQANSVLAVFRSFPEQNPFLLLINFATTSQEVKLEETYLPASDVSTPTVVLTDQSSNEIIGKHIDLTKIKLEPKQFHLIEFVPT